MLFLPVMRTFFAACALAACAARPRGLPPSSAPRFDVETPVLMGPVEAVAAPADVLAWAPLSDGARVALHADGALTLDLDGRSVARATVRHPERCALAPWGARAVAFCADDGVEAATLGASIPRLVVLRADASQWVPARDGRTLTRRGACDPSDADASVMVACSLEADGRWREWRTDAPGALLDRHGAYALVTRCARDAPCAVSLFEIDLARWRPVLLSDPAARWVRAGFDADGRVVGIVHTGAREAVGWFVRGAPEASLRALRLPEPADDCATDGRDGAVFLRGAAAWVTDDGGLSLRPLRGWRDGEASPRGAAPGPVGMRAVCSAGACAIARSFEVRLPRRGAGVP